jgi:hypothetical protein
MGCESIHDHEGSDGVVGTEGGEYAHKEQGAGGGGVRIRAGVGSEGTYEVEGGVEKHRSE